MYPIRLFYILINETEGTTFGGTFQALLLLLIKLCFDQVGFSPVMQQQSFVSASEESKHPGMSEQDRRHRQQLLSSAEASEVSKHPGMSEQHRRHRQQQVQFIVIQVFPIKKYFYFGVDVIHDIIGDEARSCLFNKMKVYIRVVGDGGWQPNFLNTRPRITGRLNIFTEQVQTVSHIGSIAVRKTQHIKNLNPNSFFIILNRTHNHVEFQMICLISTLLARIDLTPSGASN